MTSEAAEKRPQAGWQLVTFAIVLSSDPSAASGTIKKLLDDGALWSLDTTRRTTVLFMVAVLAIIDVLSLLDNFRFAPCSPLTVPPSLPHRNHAVARTALKEQPMHLLVCRRFRETPGEGHALTAG